MSDPNAYVDRLRQEEQQLSERLTKLALFIDADPNFSGIVRSGQIRLELQRGVMQAYLALLRARLQPPQSDSPAELAPAILKAVEISQNVLVEDLLTRHRKVATHLNNLNFELNFMLADLHTYDELLRYRDPFSDIMAPPKEGGGDG